MALGQSYGIVLSYFWVDFLCVIEVHEKFMLETLAAKTNNGGDQIIQP